MVYKELYCQGILIFENFVIKMVFVFFGFFQVILELRVYSYWVSGFCKMW